MIIDTETHVLRFARSYFNNPKHPMANMTREHTWREQPAALLVAEMDQAGVDKAFLLSYDAEDIDWGHRQKGFSIEDFSGGRKYTLVQARAFPDRFLWFNTLKDPRREETLEQIREDASIGMVGIKIFPAYIDVSLVQDEMRAVWDLCRELDLRVLISLENVRLSRTRTLPTYMHELDEVLGSYADLRFTLLHAGSADPLTPAADEVFRVTRAHSNLYLSTAILGMTTAVHVAEGETPPIDWEDGSEYPYPNYLRRMEHVCNEVGANRVMWATDWPWMEWAFKYEQGLNSIRRHAKFLSDEDKALVLGGNAEEFMGSRIKDQVQPEG